jgi:hypothetical protein
MEEAKNDNVRVGEDSTSNDDKAVTLLNISKDSTNMNVSVAHSVLNWISNLFYSSKGTEDETKV